MDKVIDLGGCFGLGLLLDNAMGLGGCLLW